MLNIFKEKELTAKEKQEIINEKVAELKNDLEEIQDEIKIQEGRQTKALINNRSDIAEQAREKVSELYSERNGIVNSIKLLEQEQQELGESAIREKIEDLLEQQEQLKEQNSKESKQGVSSRNGNYRTLRICPTIS